MRAITTLLIFAPPIVFPGLAYCATLFASWWDAAVLFAIGWSLLGLVVSLGIWQRQFLKSHWDKLWRRKSADKTTETDAAKAPKDKEEKEEDEYATVRFAIIWGVVLFLLVSGLWLTFGMAPYLRTGHQNFQAHEFGDSFGFVNTWFSGLAFAGVILAIILQTIELKQQREELQSSVKAQQETSQALLISMYTDALLAYEEAWKARNESLTHRNSYIQLQSIIDQLATKANTHIKVPPGLNKEQWGHALFEEMLQAIELYLPKNCNPASVSTKQVLLINDDIQRLLPLALGLTDTHPEHGNRVLALAKNIDETCKSALKNPTTERLTIARAVKEIQELHFALGSYKSWRA